MKKIYTLDFSTPTPMDETNPNFASYKAMKEGIEDGSIKFGVIPFANFEAARNRSIGQSINESKDDVDKNGKPK